MTRKDHDPHKIRQTVSEDYAKAVSRKARETPSECGCCKKPAPKGVVAKLAGYSDEELMALPEEAVINSFGCGNPLAFSEVKVNDVVLDLGCGAGIDLLLAARKVGQNGKVIGIDMTDEMVAKAKENVKLSKLHNVEVRKGFIEHLPVEDSSVDWVISNCVINLSPEKEKVFAEIARVLKPGGHMLVADIVAEHLPQAIIDHPELYSSCLSGAISEKHYLEGLHAAGLINAKVLMRLKYDESQLRAFIGSELKEEQGKGCGCTRDLSQIDEWLKILKGKVWSAKIKAQKPLAN